tara:strand:- start:2308 stop:4680 length:2373 start_codon:yes stop_codon:yes gene_type:complete
MSLNQEKLTKKEWEELEKPVTDHENYINSLIIEGFTNVNIRKNKSLSLIDYLKLSYDENNDKMLFCEYLQDDLIRISKSTIKKLEKPKQKNIKKMDFLRIKNMNTKLSSIKKNIFEFIMLKLLSKMYKSKKKSHQKWIYYYVTIKILLSSGINYNKCFGNYIELVLQEEQNIEIINVIKNASIIYENNEYLSQFVDYKLYSHQKDMFTLCKSENPKLFAYVAPTGTGKTLTPLGLSEKYRIIFLCAARHVGLSFAKSAISSRKKVAFAFGCETQEDIRLHYFAAKNYTIHNRSGGIGKVDNSVGDNVEIMICDIKSYLHAMHYMLEFNEKEKIILYWDEPTITLDYSEHIYHEIIKVNWINNVIPNIVLASATLPKICDMHETISDFRSRFNNAEIHSLVSHEFKKSLSLIDKEGFVYMPHYESDEYEVVKEIALIIKENRTLLRYLDLNEIINFIVFISENENMLNSERYLLKNYMSSIDNINIENLKLYYLDSLSNISGCNWKTIYKHFQDNKKKRYLSTIHFVTKDANTLTNGPVIFITNDVHKIAKFCIQEAKIPNIIITNIKKAINTNNKINETIIDLQKKFEDGTDEKQDKKLTNGRVGTEMRNVLQEISKLKKSLKNIILDSVFVPNSPTHLQLHCKEENDKFDIPFTSDVSEYYVKQIMNINNVDDIFKLLLFMGIGVFTKDAPSDYNEIIKTLAQEQKLYLIVASSDFIYGTNYQFTHGYIGNDLKNITQEKCIQAMGRIGRGSCKQNYTIRFRDNILLRKLFQVNDNKLEAQNMCKLFNT